MNNNHPLKELRQFYKFERDSRQFKLLRIIRIKEILKLGIKNCMTHRFKGDWSPDKIKAEKKKLEEELKLLLKEVEVDF